MKKFNLLILYFFCGLGVSWALPPSPMEAVTKYNVVLVHGAADSSSGFIAQCGGDVYDAYTLLSLNQGNPDSNSWKLGGATGMFGSYHERMDEKPEKLTNWLDSALFEDYSYRNGLPYIGDIDTLLYGSSVIYIQRSFANPAESPAHNAVEIGDRTWKGDNNCSVRRSLFEEAQEVRAHGQDSLRDLRSDTTTFAYRSIPSRNIIISHSMGGVASREYVQGDGYNHDVDKLITLDSPHEGTGALNMLLDLTDPRFTSLGGQLEVYTQLAAWSLVALIAKQNQIAAIALPITFLTNYAEIFAKYATDIALHYGYKYTDPLAKYINPDTDLLDDIFGSYEPGINVLKNKTKTDSLPMFRLLYSTNALTFTDPGRGWYNSMDLLVPDALTGYLGNLISQLSSDVPGGVKFGNAFVGSLLGSVGVSMQETGSSLIPSWSGSAENTDVLNSPNVNVERVPFNAAMNASESAGSNLLFDNMALVVAALATLDVALSWNQIACTAAKVGALTVATASFLPLVQSVMVPVIDDFNDSHGSPVMSKYQSQWYGTKKEYSSLNKSINSGSVKPFLMEDFLYEKPFVNLGLFVSADSLRDVDANCFYGADVSDTTQDCEIGLYGANGEMVSKTGRRNYKEFRKSPLAFKSSSDWSSIGMKMDRWERVDGLKPDGSENPGGVPIRHVERYNVPAITVDNWIEKYSFVVDDLMPHRLRQIRLADFFR